MKILKNIIILPLGILMIFSCNSSSQKKLDTTSAKEVEKSTQMIIQVDSTRKINTQHSIDTASNPARNIQWHQKQAKEIGELNEKNDSIIDLERKPSSKKSQLVFQVSSSPGSYKEPSKEWKEYSDKIIQQYKDEGRISDDKVKKNRLAIVKTKDSFTVQEYLTEVWHFYNEANNDVENAIRIIGSDTVLSNDIFLMFKEVEAFPIGEISLTKIESENNRWILPDAEFIYNDSNEYLRFTYTGILTVPFQFKGIGTIEPTYINVVLVVNDSLGNQQEIFKLPHTFSERLHRVFLCDINGDNRMDIILDVENEWSEYRYLYLSNLENEVIKYGYIGKMELWRDDP